MKDRKERKMQGKRKSWKDGEKKNFFEKHKDSDSSAFDNFTSEEDSTDSDVPEDKEEMSQASPRAPSRSDSVSDRKVKKKKMMVMAVLTINKMIVLTVRARI